MIPCTLGNLVILLWSAFVSVLRHLLVSLCFYSFYRKIKPNPPQIHRINTTHLIQWVQLKLPSQQITSHIVFLMLFQKLPFSSSTPGNLHFTACRYWPGFHKGSPTIPTSCHKWLLQFIFNKRDLELAKWKSGWWSWQITTNPQLPSLQSHDFCLDLKSEISQISPWMLLVLFFFIESEKESWKGPTRIIDSWP